MTLKPLLWSGSAHSLQIRRHWNHFFDLVPICEVLAPKMETILPQGAGYHIMSLHQLVESARPHFDRFDNFWNYSKEMCDQYCDYYVMKRPMEGNQFAEHQQLLNNTEAVAKNFAKKSRGYIGLSH
jgi:hypothetical protein